MSTGKEEGTQVKETPQVKVISEDESKSKGESSEKVPKKENIPFATSNISAAIASSAIASRPPTTDMSSQIDKNNTDLTASIANAINLTNSVAGITPGANPAPGVGQLQSLFPLPGSMASLNQALVSNGLVGAQGAAAGVAEVAPRAGVAVAPPAMAPGLPVGMAPAIPLFGAMAGAPMMPGAPAPLPRQEVPLLSLLTSNSNFLTPTEMALPVNDPSVFMPTPFAPGQNANTLQTDLPGVAAAVARSRLSSSTPDSLSSIDSTPLVDAIRSAVTGHTIQGLSPPQTLTMPGVPGVAGVPGVVGLPAAAAMAGAAGGQQNSFLQQLAAAYAMGGAGGQQYNMFAPAHPALQPQQGLMLPGQTRPIDLSAAAAAGIDINSLMAAGYPAAAINPALAGYHPAPALNPALAGYPPAATTPAAFNAALNPALAGLPGLGLGSLAGAAGLGSLAGAAGLGSLAGAAGLGSLTGAPGLGSLANANLTGNNLAAAAGAHPTVSSNASSASGQPNASQEDIIKNAALQKAATAAAAQGLLLPTPNQQKSKSSKKSENGGADPLIKSREARWIIRYNELLEFRREHGHCRVPHGYAPNRKLSWWVMNQRAQFAHRNQGKKAWLTDDRIQMLNDIGFIWTPHLKRSGGGGGKKKRKKSESSLDNANEDDKDKKRRKSEISQADDCDDNDKDDANKAVKTKAEV